MSSRGRSTSFRGRKYGRFRRGGRQSHGQQRDHQSGPSGTTDSSQLDHLITLVEQLKQRVDEFDITESKKRKNPTPTGGSSNKMLRRSTNPEFQLLTKELFKHSLLDHAAQNWASVPEFLDSGVQKLMHNIQVPNGSKEFYDSLMGLGHQFSEQVACTVRTFLDKELSSSSRRLGELDATDADMARDIANKYLDRRLGKRVNAAGRQQLMDTAGKCLTSSYCDKSSTPTAKASLHQETLVTANEGKTTGKRKPATPSPVDTLHKTVHFVLDSDEETAPEASLDKPEHKRARPSSHYLQRSSGVHVFTGDKEDWILDISRKVVVLGDSNMRMAEASPDFEFLVLPGANLHHVTEAINKWQPTNANEQHVLVVQVGINNRCMPPEKLDLEIKALNRAVSNKPQFSRFCYVGVSVTDSLPQTEVKSIKHLNQRMLDLVGDENFVEPLEASKVIIQENDRYGIHYSTETRKTIVDSIHQLLPPSHI